MILPSAWPQVLDFYGGPESVPEVATVPRSQRDRPVEHSGAVRWYAEEPGRVGGPVWHATPEKPGKERPGGGTLPRQRAAPRGGGRHGRHHPDHLGWLAA